MYKIFTEVITSNNSISQHPSTSYIKTNYNSAILTIIDYFNQGNHRVKSNHLLSRILTDAYIPLDYDFDKYINIAYARSPYVAKLHDITSDINYGKIHHGVFYHNTDEILIYTESYISTTIDLNNWSKLQPITVIKHNISDLGMGIPDGSDNTTGGDVAVLCIDIPLLLVMFRGYGLSRILLNNPVQISNFIASYVLPNILYSQSEIAILNRLIYTYKGIPHTETTKTIPIVHQATLTLQDKLDRLIKFTLNHIVNSPIRYESLLSNIISLNHIDMQDALIMPDIVRTRQVWWALYLSKLWYIKSIIDIGGVRGMRKNRDLIADMRINLNRIRNDNIYSAVLGEDLAYDVNELISALLVY